MGTHNEDMKAAIALYRTSFVAFLERAMEEISSTPFKHNWHHDAIAWELAKVVDGGPNLIVNLPPRHLKSRMISVVFVAWTLGHAPATSFICISYSDDLAVDLHNETRKLMKSSFYQKVFPGTKISSDKDTENEFKTTAGGGRRATSVGGSLTGFGGDFIIVDDLVSAADAVSDKKIENANKFFLNTVLSRVNGMHTRTIMVMQRIAPEDVTSIALESGTWTHLCLPAIATNVEYTRIGPSPHHVYVRQPSEALHPEHLNLEWLLNQRKLVGEHIFNAQWQQQPTPEGGNLLKLEQFRRYTELPPYYHGQGYFVSFDPAVAGGEHNDYAVFTVWFLKGTDVYLVDVIREKLEFSKLVDLAIAVDDKYLPKLFLIEQEATGIALGNLLRAQGRTHVRLAFSSKDDKVTRAKIQQKKIADGRVWLPKEAPWLLAFEKEVREFPASKHDDQVDSMTQFLAAIDFPKFWTWIKMFGNPKAA